MNILKLFLDMKVSTFLKRVTIVGVAVTAISACSVADDIQKAQEVRNSRQFDVVCVDNGKTYFHETVTNLEYSHHASQYGRNSNGKIVVFMNGCIATEK